LQLGQIIEGGFYMKMALWSCWTFRRDLWRRRLVGVLAICGLNEKPPAGRRRHEELAFCDKIRSFRPPGHIVVGNAG